MVTKLDPVASRLASADHAEPSLVLGWIEVRQRCDLLQRRSFWCNLGAWLLVTFAAVVASGVAIKFAHDTRETFGQIVLLQSGYSYDYETINPPITIRVIPPLLSLIAGVLLFGGLVAWSFGRFPGHSWSSSAIDWSRVSDAVWRLLSVGCTYPEAFETAAKIAQTSRNRLWLRRAAERIQQGAANLPLGGAVNSDTAMLETLVETNDADTSPKWWLAREHFDDVADRRVALLQATIPIMSVLLSGLLIWMSISATLGWMWLTVARMITGVR